MDAIASVAGARLSKPISTSISATSILIEVFPIPLSIKVSITLSVTVLSAFTSLKDGRLVSTLPVATKKDTDTLFLRPISRLYFSFHFSNKNSTRRVALKKYLQWKCQLSRVRGSAVCLPRRITTM